MRNLIFVDIDDTVHDFGATCSLVALNEFGVRVTKTPVDWMSFILEDIDKCLKIFKRTHDREYIFLSKPFPGSVESLTRLQEMGYEIHYLSDRKAESLDDTKDWLRENGFPNWDNLSVSTDKRGFMMEYKDRIATVIDDRPRTLIFSRFELGIPHVFSLKFSYNQNLTDIPGVHLSDSWEEIMRDFEQFMVLEKADEQLAKV